MSHPTLRVGDESDRVMHLQGCLRERTPGLVIDGKFGPRTEDAVVAFQRDAGLLPDGIVGPLTWQALDAPEPDQTPAVATSWARVTGFTPVPLGGAAHGYTRSTLRAETAAKWTEILRAVTAAGGVLTSAGGRRQLGTNGANRAMASLHKTGRAHDLALYSAGGEDPGAEPLLLTRIPDAPKRCPLLRVLVAVQPALAAELPDLVSGEVSAWRRHGFEATIRGYWLDLTAMLARVGILGIPPRASWWRGSYGGLEWWHFQDTEGLVVGESTFGAELAAIWPREALLASEEYRVAAGWRWTGVGFAP